MIPAVETQLAGSRIGDIGSVPAVTVEIISGHTVIPCIGLLDTGADISVLDEKIFDSIPERLAPSGRILATTGFSKEQSVIYHIGLRIKGESKQRSLSFDSVPVAVAALHRQLLVIGRRGVLDRLKLELDFPRKRIVLTRPTKHAGKYPSLTREFPSFEAIMEAIEQGHLTDAILALSWEMEYFLDRMITENEILRKIHEETPTKHRTLSQKFDLIYGCLDSKGIDKAIRKFIEVRNNAVHARAFRTPDRASVESLLIAAETVVSRLTQRAG
jgi:hypothetical protein